MAPSSFTASLLVLLTAAVLPAHAQDAAAAAEDRNCDVSKFRVQPNFNVSAFVGEWHVTSDVKLFPHQHRLDGLFKAFSNIRTHFQLQGDLKIVATSVGRALGICLTRYSEGERVDFKVPAKLQFTPAKSWLPFGGGSAPFWVVWTDYEAALIYSCRKVQDDGSCDAQQTFSWTLNRNSEGHSEEQLQTIGEHTEQLCLEASSFIPMKQSSPCAKLDIPDIVQEEPKAEQKEETAEEKVEATEDEPQVDDDEAKEEL